MDHVRSGLRLCDFEVMEMASEELKCSADWKKLLDSVDTFLIDCDGKSRIPQPRHFFFCCLYNIVCVRARACVCVLGDQRMGNFNSPRSQTIGGVYYLWLDRGVPNQAKSPTGFRNL